MRSGTEKDPLVFLPCADPYCACSGKHECMGCGAKTGDECVCQFCNGCDRLETPVNLIVSAPAGNRVLCYACYKKNPADQCE